MDFAKKEKFHDNYGVDYCLCNVCAIEEVAWPSGLGVGFEVFGSRVRVPL